MKFFSRCDNCGRRDHLVKLEHPPGVYLCEPCIADYRNPHDMDRMKNE